MPTIPIIASFMKPQYFLYLGAAIVIALGLWHLHYRIDKGGYDRAMHEVSQRDAKAAKKLKTIRKDSKDELQNVDRDALIKYFCSTNRVRNPEHCPK